ncbi:MAG: GIY-YIG nuclease family protein [Thermomicrobiales bacterium]
MPTSICYLFKNVMEYRPAADIEQVPNNTRGIYVLYKAGRGRRKSVVYIGMASGEKSGAKGRLKSHRRRKADLWTHFSVFEVWDNITREQVQELEGMFRHIYRHDPKANRLNVQKSYRPLVRVRRKSEKTWA